MGERDFYRSIIVDGTKYVPAADLDRYRELVERLVRLCGEEERQDGFPFNFELRNALREARQLLGDNEEDNGCTS